MSVLSAGIYLAALLASRDVILSTRTHSATVPACGGLIAANPSSQEIFNACAGSVAVIDARTLETVETIAGASHVSGIAVDSTLNRAYITDPFDSALTVFDRASGDVLTVGSGGRFGPVVNPVTHKVYTTPGVLIPRSGLGWSHISVVDGTSLERHAILTEAGPASIAVDSMRNRIYVACLGDMFGLGTSVTVIEGETENRTDVVVGPGPIDVAVDALNGVVAVANSGGIFLTRRGPPSVTLLDASSLTVTAVVPLETAPTLIDVDPSVGKIYVALSASPSLVEIDEKSLVETVIPLRAPVTRLAVDPTTSAVYTLQEHLDSVFRIDGHSHKVTDFQVGVDPRDIVVDSSTNTAWVSSGDNSLTVLRPGTRTIQPRPMSP